MTLNDILVSALAQLGRGHDAQTMELFRARLTDYANDAQDDIARELLFSRTETVPAPQGTVELEALSRDCIRVEKTVQLGGAVPFRETDTGRIELPYDAPAEITYRCLPKKLASPADVPELPSHTHGLIVSYVVGRERMAGDVSTQRGANIYLSMYEAAKSRLRPHAGDPASYRIVNRWR